MAAALPIIRAARLPDLSEPAHAETTADDLDESTQLACVKGVGVEPLAIGPYSIVKDLNACRTLSIRFSMLSGAELRSRRRRCGRERVKLGSL